MLVTVRKAFVFCTLKVLKSHDVEVTAAKWFDSPYFPDTVINASPFTKIVHDTYQQTRGEAVETNCLSLQPLLRPRDEFPSLLTEGRPSPLSSDRSGCCIRLHYNDNIQ